MDTSASVALERDTLYAVIGAIAQGPELERVLPPIVEVLTGATGCHACFVYLLEGERLRLRAASRVFADAVGRVELGIDEGLTGWVARHREPAFIRDRALDDPRMRYVPELQEERFQSMVAVPLIGRDDGVVGVVVLHTEAPREFGRDVLDLLVHVASLVGGAIENARLYEETRRQVATLSALSTLSRDIAAAAGREELYALATDGVRGLLGADAARLYLLGADGERLELAAALPPVTDPAERDGTGALLNALRGADAAGPPAEGDRSAEPGTAAGAPSGEASSNVATTRAAGDRPAPVAAVPLTAGGDDLGALAVTRARPLSDADLGLLRAVAGQLAVALRQADLIERLTEETAVRDLFAALERGDLAGAETRAVRARADLTRAHVLVCALPPAGDQRPWPALAERVEGRLRRLVPGALCDAGGEQLRALLPVPTGGDLDGELERVAADERIALGRAAARPGLREGDRALAEATDAARVARALHPEGGALEHDALGAYRYLVRLPPDALAGDRQGRAVQSLLEYDRRRRAELTVTLERYLAERGSVTNTAAALFIHPNTLRQRLDRIQQIAEIDLGDEDLLSLELALKLARLSDPP